MPNPPNIVIVGAGVLGCSTAYWASALGCKNVTLIEQATLGAGATGNSVGIVRAHHANDVETALSVCTKDVIQSWTAKQGGISPYEPRGLGWLFPATEVENVAANVERSTRLGARSEIIEGRDVKQLFPYLRTAEDTVAVHESEAGTLNPTRLIHCLLSHAVAHGVDIREQTAVSAIATHNNTVIGVHTRDGYVPADIVVIASGAWVTKLLAATEISIPIVPRLILTGLLTSIPWPSNYDGGVIMDSIHGTYFRPWGDNARIRICEPLDPCSPDAITGALSLSVVAQARQRICETLPWLAAAETAGVYGHLDGYTPDHHPVVGPIDKVEGLYVLAGGSGRALKLGVGLGRALCDLILDSTDDLFDASVLSPLRFSNGAGYTSSTQYKHCELTTLA